MTFLIQDLRGSMYIVQCTSSTATNVLDYSFQKFARHVIYLYYYSCRQLLQFLHEVFYKLNPELFLAFFCDFTADFLSRIF